MSIFSKRRKQGLTKPKTIKLILLSQDIEDQGLGDFPYEFILTIFNGESYELPAFKDEASIRKFYLDVIGSNELYHEKCEIGEFEVYYIMVPAYCFDTKYIREPLAFFHISNCGELNGGDQEIINHVLNTVEL